MWRIRGGFWTLERDEKLRRLEGEGLSAAKIAQKLGTTRDAVLGRLHRLSGVALTYPSYVRLVTEMRARSTARMKQRERLTNTVIPKMKQEIARGMDRDGAIAKARKAGVTLKAIGDALGLTRERIRQITAKSD